MAIKISSLLFILFLSLPSLAVGQWRLSLGLDENSYSIKTKASASTNSASTSFVATELTPSVQLFITKKIQFSVNYSQTLLGDYDINGFGTSVRYYFKGGSFNNYSNSSLKIQEIPKWSTFAEVGYKYLSVGAGTVDIKFNRIDAGAGVERYLKDYYFAFLKVHAGQLSSSSTRSGTVMGLSLGLGKYF